MDLAIVHHTVDQFKSLKKITEQVQSGLLQLQVRGGAVSGKWAGLKVKGLEHSSRFEVMKELFHEKKNEET